MTARRSVRPEGTGLRGHVRRRLRRLQVERGSAVVEFLGVSILLLVPIVYLVLTLSRVQAAAFAAEGAAREAGRILAQGLDPGVAGAAVELAFEDQGFDVLGGEVLTFSCEGGGCTEPGVRVLVEVATSVDLPLLPDMVRATVPAHVPIRATHLAVVGEFRGVS